MRALLRASPAVLAVLLSCGPTLPNGGKCTPQSCTGCCNAGACVALDAQNDSLCGVSGAECTGCGQGNHCGAGVCAAAATCAINNGGCDPHATCVMYSTGPSCSCATGYVGDGHACSPRLSSLTITPGSVSPFFAPDRDAYVAIVPSGTTMATLIATAGDAASMTMQINGVTSASQPIAVGATPTTVNVDLTAATSGRRHRYTVAVSASTTTLAQTVALKPSIPGAGLRFGTAVAISADGSVVAIGAPMDSSDATGVNGAVGATQVVRSGAVFVYRLTGAAWLLEAFIKAPNREAYDQFGGAVALSADGLTLLVGATGDDSNARGVGGSQTDNTQTDCGAAWVYKRGAAPTSWAVEAYLKATNAEAHDGFGWAVALSADGNTALVGAPFEDSAASRVGGDESDNSLPSSGAAYVFGRSGASWSSTAYVKASNPGQSDNFGRALAVSGDGNVLAVGAAGEDSKAAGVGGNGNDNSMESSGAVYTYRRAGAFAFDAYLKADAPDVQARFGTAVALSQDGAVLAVGAPGESTGGLGVNPMASTTLAPGSGAAYVFRHAAAWTQEAFVKETNTDPGDGAGSSVALSSDGATLAVGAPNEDGDATGVDGPEASNGAGESGAVFLFRNAGGWARLAYVKASNTGGADQFGYGCGLSSTGAALVVAAPGEDSDMTGAVTSLSNDNAMDRGACYVFHE